MSARGSVTLSDFGCSKVIISGNEYLERCNGTPAFLAPEMMRPHSRYRQGFKALRPSAICTAHCQSAGSSRLAVLTLHPGFKSAALETGAVLKFYSGLL